jgi:hypothetical protein
MYGRPVLARAAPPQVEDDDGAIQLDAIDAS